MEMVSIPRLQTMLKVCPTAEIKTGRELSKAQCQLQATIPAVGTKAQNRTPVKTMKRNMQRGSS